MLENAALGYVCHRAAKRSANPISPALEGPDGTCYFKGSPFPAAIEFAMFGGAKGRVEFRSQSHLRIPFVIEKREPNSPLRCRIFAKEVKEKDSTVRKASSLAGWLFARFSRMIPCGTAGRASCDVKE